MARCVCLCDYYILHTLEDGWHVTVRDSQLREQQFHRKRGRWMEKHTGGTTEEQRGGFRLKGWVGCCVTGHIERERYMTHEA